MADSYDYIIIGSGFGGAVSALRLAEKGYSVLVLDKGKRFSDEDFARTNWQFWKYLWAPALRSFGILQIGILKGLMVLHGSGVGGGSLGYANVLEVPNEQTFATPAWNQPLAWGRALRPHYETARRMLGVTQNPQLWKADEVMRELAKARDTEATFRATEVGVFFGREGQEEPDPYFDGRGPARTGCKQCGGCMVGCRYNAKNTLPKNYLFLAEKLGVEICAEAEVVDVRPLTVDGGPSSEAGYRVTYKKSTGWFGGSRHEVRGRNVVFSAGVMGTIALLLRLRDVNKSLPLLSQRLGEMVRTNSEALLGSVARTSEVDYSRGIAITSIFNSDAITRAEPVRYPDGSSLMRLLAAPLIDLETGVLTRILRSLAWTLRHPIDALRALVLPGWAHNTTILLIMQNTDNRMRLRLGRSIYTFFARGLVADKEPGYEIHALVNGSHALAREFAAQTDGVAMGSLGENLLNLPTTAHILGGAPIGRDAGEGVVDGDFRVHNYPGLFIVDGSVVPANPGVNPSLTITALAEYAMAKVPARA